MEFTSKNPVLKESLADDIILDAVANVLTSHLHIHLFKAGPSSPTPQNVLADFTQADFVGYAAHDFDTATAMIVNLPNGNGRGVFVNALFAAGAVVAPGQSALGWYMTDVTNAILYWSEVFPDPYLFVNNGDFLDMTVFVPMLTIGTVG